MLKRIFFIIAYPFMLLYYVISFPFKIAYIIISDRKGSKKKTDTSAGFDITKVGHLLFPDLHKDFDAFLKLYTTDKTEFGKKYKEIQPDSAELSPLELIQSFGDINQKLGFIDWKGQEDEFEIQDFIQEQIRQDISWTKSNNLKQSVAQDKQRNGKFIVKYFQAIDTELRLINFRLLFLNMGWDAYVFLPVTSQAFDKIFQLAPNQFENANEL